MHRCWKVVELSDLIAEQVAPDLKALARMAQVCGWFHRAAVRPLWYRQNTILNLIKCLPSDSWRSEIDGEAEVVFLTRPMLCADWIRMRYYATRIKILATSSFTLDTELWRTLSFFSKGQALLPNLVEFSWSGRAQDNALFPFYRLFLTPKLKTLRLGRWCLSNEECFSLLSHIRSSKLRLGMLHISVDTDTVFASVALAVELSNFHHLRSFTIGRTISLSYELLSCIASMPILEELEVNADLRRLNGFDVRPTAVSTCMLPLCFAQLKRLTLEPHFTCDCQKLLELVKLPVITHLHIKPYRGGEPIDEQDWDVDVDDISQEDVHGLQPTQDLLQIIHSHCGRASLRSLVLETSPMDHWASEVIDPFALEEFCDFANIEEFIIDTVCDIDLTDTTMQMMADSWPNLRSLKILRDWFPSNEGHDLCLWSLVPFAEHCSFLEKLCLPIDTTSWTIEIGPGERPGDGFMAESLNYIHFGAGPAGDANEIASFLSDIFPNVRQIELGDSENELPGPWVEVNNLLEATFQAQAKTHDVEERPLVSSSVRDAHL